MTVIYDPVNPPAIFDGRLDVYTTCRSCQQIMKVTVPDQHSHPCCVIIETPIETLETRLLMELRNGLDDDAADTEAIINTLAKAEIGDAAVTFTEWMWPVFPLARLSKKPAIPKSKGGTGFKQATTDTERIQRWWTKHPEHNIGLATGVMFDVIDIDTKDNKGNPSFVGIQSFLKCLHDGDIAETHGVAVTASGGLHLYVKRTGRGCFAAIRPGIDYRGKGGYVVAPPSLIQGPGRDYTWLVEPSPIIKGDF